MNRSLILSIVLTILATIWVLSGSFTEPDPSLSQPENTSAEKALFKVKVKSLTAEKMHDQIILQGAVDAVRQIEVKAETSGTVESISSSKGDRLRSGQSILNLAMNDREARLEKAKAELRVKESELASSKSLRNKSMVSENRYQQNLADVIAAQAQVKEIEVEIEHTRIKAAFSGVLNDVHVELGEYVTPGMPIASLVDQDQLSISTDVPQQHIGKLALGQTVEATLLSGQVLTGKINYISSTADSATRTFKIEANAKNTVGMQHFGQSARVKIYLGERAAYLISPSLLNLGADGSLQIKTLDQEQRVTSHDVSIIRSDNDGVWLAGLPEKIDLISVGQGFVAVGEQVEVLSENETKLDSPSKSTIDSKDGLQ